MYMIVQKTISTFLLVCTTLASAACSEEAKAVFPSANIKAEDEEQGQPQENSAWSGWKPLALASTLFLTTLTTIVLVAQSNK
jgi:hypothetical protein